MASLPCPHCGKNTFSWRDKYRTGKWAILHCVGCSGRVCAQPIVIALLYFLYAWDVLLLGFLAFFESLWYLLVMVVGFAILDYFSLYIPLTALRTAEKGNSVPTSKAEMDACEGESAEGDAKSVAAENNAENQDKTV